MSNFQNTLSFCEQIFLSRCLQLQYSNWSHVHLQNWFCALRVPAQIERDLSCVLGYHRPPKVSLSPIQYKPSLPFWASRPHTHYFRVHASSSSAPILSSGLADLEQVSDQKLDKVSFVLGLRCVRSSLYVARSVYDSTLLRKRSHLGLAGAVIRDSKLNGLSYYFWRGV